MCSPLFTNSAQFITNLGNRKKILETSRKLDYDEKIKLIGGSTHDIKKGNDNRWF